MKSELTKVGTMLNNSKILGHLAQSVEHLTFNQRVAGSNPAMPTKTRKGLRDLRVGLKLFGYTSGILMK